VVSRLEGRHPDLFDPADVTGDDLVSVVDGLLALPANGNLGGGKALVGVVDPVPDVLTQTAGPYHPYRSVG
jgi:hypothetical protein